MITQEELKQQVYYNQETGQFWRKYPNFSKLITAKNENGYIRFGVGYDKDYGHRWAWFYVFGYKPKDHLDHINMDHADNRICNLREATSSQNQQNYREPKSHNKLKVRGVCKLPNGKFLAYIGVDKKQKYLGCFFSLNEAINARIEAQKVYHSFAKENLSYALQE